MAKNHDQEFERNRQEILKRTSMPMDVAKTGYRHAWEIELKEYRKQKRREKYYFFGSTLGIISFVLVVLSHYQEWLALFAK